MHIVHTSIPITSRTCAQRQAVLSRQVPILTYRYLPKQNMN